MLGRYSIWNGKQTAFFSPSALSKRVFVYMDVIYHKEYFPAVRAFLSKHNLCTLFNHILSGYTNHVRYYETEKYEFDINI
jgi:hypothetical protein